MPAGDFTADSRVAAACPAAGRKGAVTAATATRPRQPRAREEALALPSVQVHEKALLAVRRHGNRRRPHAPPSEQAVPSLVARLWVILVVPAGRPHIGSSE